MRPAAVEAGGIAKRHLGNCGSNTLARSYQFLEQLSSFTTYNNQKRTELSTRLEQLNRVLGKGERK
jgi:hypothetical protein